MKLSRVLIIVAAICGPGFVAAEEPMVSSQTVSISSSPLVSTAAVVTEPYLWPVTRKLQGKSVVASKFGKREVPKELTPTAAAPVQEVHEGLDLAVPAGTTVRASRSGKVLFAGFSKSYTRRADKKQQNRLVIIRHADGMSTRYIHLATIKVRPPQEIQAGDVIGTTEASDEWTSPVLHFEIRNAVGKPLDPLSLLTESK